jgi:transcriptional regulator with GAF, ATPase, and Fis domain
MRTLFGLTLCCILLRSLLFAEVRQAYVDPCTGLLPNPLRATATSIVAISPPAATLSDSERALIHNALEATAWVIGGANGAAAKLGLKRTTLICKMQKLGICRPDLQSSPI